MKEESKKEKTKHSFLYKLWYFLWKDNSIWSLLIGIFLSFIVVKFVIYPVLGAILKTSFPVVAVLTSSMEHHPRPSGRLCGRYLDDYKKYNNTFDNYWKMCGLWYEKNNISKEEFKRFPFHNGFNVGDVLIVKGADINDYKVGDVIVFWSNLKYPIIHRIVKIDKKRGIISTKGDQNSGQLPEEKNIRINRVLGKAIFRIPYLGYVKVGISKLVNRGIG